MDNHNFLPDMLDALADASLFAPEATVVVEHAKQQAPSECRRLARLADYRYGDTGVRLLSVLQEATVGAQERPEPARD